MGVQLQTLALSGPDGAVLRADLRRDPERKPRAAVVVVHGFKGFRRWGFFPFVGEQLAAAGFASLCFDFSHNGVGEDGETFTELEAFAKNTLSREADELGAVIEWVRANVEREVEPVGLLGHSRAAVSVLTNAAERPAEVGAVVTWNGVGCAVRSSQAQLARWEEEGSMEFTNARTGQRMTMDYGYVVDAREHAARLEPAESAARMSMPHLILHGARDMAVPMDESELVLAARDGDPNCRLVPIERGTHTFNAVHPFEGSNPVLDKAMERTIAWFTDHLRTETA